MTLNLSRTLGRWLAPLALLAAAALQPAAADLARPINPPIATDSPGKIEVIEFFSYGCPHCAKFNPLLHAWVAKQPQDVAFKRVPITFGRAQWVNLGKLFYTLETNGDLEKLDQAVFNAIHDQGVNLYDAGSIQGWIAKQGADAKKFSETFASFGVNSKMSRAEQLAKSYKVDGVPMVVVDGRYVIEGNSYGDVLKNLDQILAKVRAEKGGDKGGKKK